MRRIAIYSCLVVVALASVVGFSVVSAMPGGDTVVVAEGFETSLGSWLPTSTGTLTRVTAPVHGGQYAASLAGVTSGGISGGGQCDAGNNYFPVISGNRYLLTAYASANATSILTARIEWRSACASGPVPGTVETPGFLGPGGQWRELTLDVIAPANANFARVSLLGSTGDGGQRTFYFDDIQVVEGPNPLSPTPTPTESSTPEPTATAPVAVTATPTITPEPTPVSQPGCLFADVCPGDYWFTPVQDLMGRGAISGYQNNTFRPFRNATRAQVAKVVVLAEGWRTDLVAGQHFRDVPAEDPFYKFIEVAFNAGIISGYEDGTFRPYNDVTRGQLTKIVVAAEGWPLLHPSRQTFSDVDPDNPFFEHIETAAARGVISGYNDGSFKWANDGTRGQIAKVVYQAVTQQKLKAALDLKQTRQ